MEILTITNSTTIGEQLADETFEALQEAIDGLNPADCIETVMTNDEPAGEGLHRFWFESEVITGWEKDEDGWSPTTEKEGFTIIVYHTATVAEVALGVAGNIKSFIKP